QVNLKDTFYNATPLTWAAMRNHAGVVRELLAAGAEGGDGALLMAARNGNVAMVRAVLDGSKPKESQLTTALAMVPEKSAEVRELLIKAGAKPSGDAGVKLDTLAGTYKADGGTSWSVAARSGLLVVSAGEQALFVLQPTGPLAFRSVEG